MKRKTSRNRLAFSASLAAGLLVALAVAAYAGGIGPTGSAGSAPVDDGVAPIEAMSVFDRPATTGEATTPAARATLEEISQDEPGVSASLLPGPADLSAARTLLSASGPTGWSLVAAPTAKGRVCSALLDGGGKAESGGCVERFSSKFPVVPGITLLESGGAVVSGLASDDVTAVAVVVDGVERQALLRNNGFVFEGSPSDGLLAVRATLNDGSRVTVPLGPSSLGD